MDPVELMWAEQMRGEKTYPFFLWVPVESRTGETVWRLWTIATGWTNHLASSCP
jgi:hypothetical protein